MVTLWLFRALSGRDAYWSIYRWNNIFGICLKYSCKKKNNGRGGEIKQKCQMLVILGAGACMQSKCPVLFSLFVLSLTISVTKFLDQQELEELGDTTKEISFASIFFGKKRSQGMESTKLQCFEWCWDSKEQGLFLIQLWAAASPSQVFWGP